MRTALLIAIVNVCQAISTSGIWKMNAARSTFTGGAQPRSLSVRIEPHAKGEVFTLDRIESDSRATSSSTILYFDGTPRDFQDFACLGTQSSRRLDAQTTEILRVCADEEWTWLIRQSAVKSKELTIDITEKRGGRSHVEWRIVLTKQEFANR